MTETAGISEAGGGWDAVRDRIQAHHAKIARARGAQATASGGGVAPKLSDADQSAVQELKARDREVRTHEQAHASVGGQYAGSPSYTYQSGPDGRRYAIGGEVPIDVSPVNGDPAATIDKMDVVKAAALAPAEPSAQDRKVAALADQQRAQAMADLAALRADARTDSQVARYA